MDAAEAEIKKAETRIAVRLAEQKRRADSSRRAQAMADEINALGSSSSGSPPSNSSNDTFCFKVFTIHAQAVKGQNNGPLQQWPVASSSATKESKHVSKALEFSGNPYTWRPCDKLQPSHSS